MTETVFTRIDISAAREALRFSKKSKWIYHEIINQYGAVVYSKIASMLAQCGESNDALRQLSEEKWNRLNKMQFHDSFFHPELLARLFYGTNSQLTAQFFGLTIDAELARKNNEFDTSVYDSLWTTNGSFLLNYNKEEKVFAPFESFSLNNCLPVDFFSPYCMRIGAEELCENDSVISGYNYETAYSVYEKLYDCMEVLEESAGSGEITSLVYDFTNVIICKHQTGNGNERHFFSSSDTYHVGRTVLGNPEMVSNEMIIDSLVHEATHALLYMIDEKYQWQPGVEISGKAGNVITSPWTGNMLSARNYLQAVFVWYALFNLWVYCLNRGIFSRQFALDRISGIQKGFKEQKIDEIRSLCGFTFDEVLISTINDIRQEILLYKK